jgi:hypothetical protein
MEAALEPSAKLLAAPWISREAPSTLQGGSLVLSRGFSVV